MNALKQKEFISSLKALLIRYDVQICEDEGDDGEKTLFFFGTPDSEDGFEIDTSVKNVMEILDEDAENEF